MVIAFKKKAKIDYTIINTKKVKKGFQLFKQFAREMKRKALDK